MTDYIFRYGTKGNPKVNEINSYDEWREAFFKYDSSKHWKDGRSAQSLAADFMIESGSGRSMLIQLVEQITGETIKDTIEAYIEHESELDNYKGKGRMQDLAVFGNLSNNKKFFIGIEAKVDETFNDTIEKTAEKIKKYKDKHHSTQQPALKTLFASSAYANMPMGHKSGFHENTATPNVCFSCERYG